jgi:trehalose-phosphatase
MSERADWRASHGGALCSPDAVLFDMDGVITDTAGAHAAAWKRLFDSYLEERAQRLGEAFRPFDLRRDYVRYVDGKPRRLGVESFLASRGIELALGSENDEPEEETVHGLGKRKDAYFRAWLEDNEVHVYPGSLRLLDALREAGIPVAVFSASRNAETVLQRAGVLDCFDAKVDGSDLIELGLSGKPDPAMLLEAARRLGVPPARAAVVEDAIAGVEAGARGAFGLVIGVARAADPGDLRTAGAHLVVRDLAELRFSKDAGLGVKTLGSLPTAWERLEAIRPLLSRATPAIFLDYDGTLSPIVEDPEEAFLSEDMRESVAALAARLPSIIVSGRDLAMLRELVGLSRVWYAGSHGFEVAGPEGHGASLEMGREFVPELDELEKALAEILADVEGHSLERKRFSLAVHYRQVAEEAVAELRSTLDEVLSEHPHLRLGHGKKVFEIRPDIDWHKGRAVLWILEQLDANGSSHVPIYVGDDVTDEDAFRALAGRGLCVAVRHDEARPTAADFALADPEDVRRFLDFLSRLARGQDPSKDATR